MQKWALCSRRRFNLKYILVLAVLFSFSYSDEIQRIESIVKDITQLRKKYQTSQEELKLKEIKEQKQDERIISLEKQIEIYKKQVKLKEKKIKKLKPKIKEKEKICKPAKIKETIIYKTQKLDNPNKFPKLILKPKYIKYKKILLKAKTYKLVLSSDIYDSTYGNKIDYWKKGTAFTSNEKAVAKNHDSWYRVTGYFIKNSWVPAKKQMWIKAKHIKND